MIRPRKLKKYVVENLNNDLVVVVTGMRRVGKTYLITDIFNDVQSNNKILLDLEKIENRKVFRASGYDQVITNLQTIGVKLTKKKTGETINKSKLAWIFLDEIQFIKEIPSVIKYLNDHFHVKFIVTGSSSYYLKNQFSESLAGRKIVLNLDPLDFGEFLVFRNQFDGKFFKKIEDLSQLNTDMMIAKFQDLFEEYIKIGGFPQIVLANTPEQGQAIMGDIISSYINIDVRTLSDIKGIDELEKLMHVLPPRIGQKVDYLKLSRVVGVSRITLKEYIKFLESTFVLSLLKPYSKSPDKEISVVPKLYMNDTGFSDYLADVDTGHKFENYVFTQLSKIYNLNYYQKKSGEEIDFILNKRIPIEVKVYGETKDLRKMNKLANSLGLSKGYVVSMKPPLDGDEEIIPAFLLGLLEI